MIFIFRTLMLYLALMPLFSAAQERVIARNLIPVISGGVGVDSEDRLKSHEASFNLKLVCTLHEGDYVAGVTVKVANAAGVPLIDHVADGPLFMARLPAGTYTVTMQYQGQSQVRKVTLRPNVLHTEHVRWRSNPQQDHPTPH